MRNWRSVRRTLSNHSEVTEKKMFGGVAFLVREKMCVTVGADGLMCRIDPARHEEALKRHGLSTVMMKGREYGGWVRVEASALPTAKELKHWVKLALDFNARAQSSKKRVNRPVSPSRCAEGFRRPADR